MKKCDKCIYKACLINQGISWRLKNYVKFYTDEEKDCAGYEERDEGVTTSYSDSEDIKALRHLIQPMTEQD